MFAFIALSKSVFVGSATEPEFIFYVEEKIANTAKGNLVKEIKEKDRVAKIIDPNGVIHVYSVSKVFLNNETGNYEIYGIRDGFVRSKRVGTSTSYASYLKGKDIYGTDENGNVHQGFNVIDVKDAFNNITNVRFKK